MRDAPLGLEAVLAPQPFGQGPYADADLRAAQHGTQETDLCSEIPLRVPPRLALDANLAPGRPEQAPFRGKVFHADHIFRTQIIAPLAHPGAWTPPDILAASRQEIRARQLAFDEYRACLGSPPITSGFSSAAVANS